MEQENFSTLLNFFKVLGNETRLKLVGFLANEELSVGELAELLNVKEPTVSHHLAMMKELGLVDFRAEGNVRIYWLETAVLQSISKDVFSQDNLATLLDDSAADSWERKTLQTFVDDNEQIKSIPSQYKKKMVIARWMSDKFDQGTQYSEREVNDIIKHHHEDSAWFRRFMVDQGIMQRDKGVYWRVGGSN
jgi:DNA-binding transcriptional ArsR family regulator